MLKELIQNTIAMYEDMLNYKLTWRDIWSGRWIRIRIMKGHARRMLEFFKQYT